MSTASLAGGARVSRGASIILGGLTLGAWVAVFAGLDANGAGIVGFVAAWTVMMVAMMLPSAAPSVLLYRRGGDAGGDDPSRRWLPRGVDGGGACTGALQAVAMDIPVPGVLAAAGLYQWTPAKRACLRRCRTPADFLVERWRANAFVLGADHGRWCLGCCWALMAVLVIAGMTGMVWVAAIAGVVAVEKLSSRGAGVARWTGVVLFVAAVWKGVS